ncbi:MAG: ThuA domain-containing protein, partial [Verrucomicrobiales bacterium]|nr:ThuA domain-containing protein [Verrucomicrobiales bacterium]
GGEVRGWLVPAVVVLWGSFAWGAEERLSVLIVDGRNNHDWATTTDSLRATLEAKGRFEVSVETAPELKVHRGPRNADDGAVDRYKEVERRAKEALRARWEDWSVDFAAFDTVVLNYNGPDWPEAMREGFVEYVEGGGGVVLVHAANNGFGNWEAFNRMIGMGWRKKLFGRALKVNGETGGVYVDRTAGDSGHGSKHAFEVAVRRPEHPVMLGLPPVWMHGKDELYHDMRGPAEGVTVLSSAYADPKQRGTGKHEPITWEVGFGKGRVMVTTMGHFWRGQEYWEGLHCVGFQTVFARSCEYVGSGEVLLGVPEGFPEGEVSVVAPHQVGWTDRSRAVVAKRGEPYRMLSPAEELATFDVEDGYEVSLAAAEPAVQEPVLTVWDGNGAMYVAEMSSYMQDEKGTGTKELKNGRIKRLEDVDGDGVYERVTVFVDGLNLPRAVLPLDDRIAVRETDSTRVVAYRDTDRDGVADEKEVLYEGAAKGRNGPGTSVEHQDSGLLWNLDNWIYVSYNEERHRFTDGEWVAQKQPSHWTQWGLAQDDTGRLFWMDNSHPLKGAQLHPDYWNTVRRRAARGVRGTPVDLGFPYDAEFMQVESLCLLNDRGGAAAEVRGFTSACGQSIYRGGKFPMDVRGDYFFVDPTIHVVRRADVVSRDGMVFLEKSEEGRGEFIRSSDINCRFVNTATGPDGVLYVTDMYRGIIQDAPWLSPGPREFIRESGLSKNVQHGRIWRVRHADSGVWERPRMLEESTVELLRHLEHPNGWWRDTAQRMIILRDDRDSVVGLLGDMVRYQENALARLHALWALEGIGTVGRELLAVCYADRDWRVRAAAVKISEGFLAEDGVIATLAGLAEDREAEVAKQLIFTLGRSDDAVALEAIQEAARRHLEHKGVMLATTVSLWDSRELPLVKEVEDVLLLLELPMTWVYNIKDFLEEKVLMLDSCSRTLALQ